MSTHSDVVAGLILADGCRTNHILTLAVGVEADVASLAVEHLPMPSLHITPCKGRNLTADLPALFWGTGLLSSDDYLGFLTWLSKITDQDSGY